MGPTGGLPLASVRLDLIRLLHHVAAITDARWIDAAGRERVLVSSIALDAVNSGRDFAADPWSGGPSAGNLRGPGAFQRGTEPFITMARRSPGPAAVQSWWT